MAEKKKFTVEVSCLDGVKDAGAEMIKKDIADLGINGVEYVKKSVLYVIEGEFERSVLEEVCNKLLSDPVVEKYEVSEGENGGKPAGPDGQKVEVFYKKGVTDTVGDSVRMGIIDLGIRGVGRVRTGFGYGIKGSVKTEEIEKICRMLLANSVIHDYKIR